MEFTNWLKKRAQLSGDSPALIFQNKTETFIEVYCEVVKRAGLLMEMGVKRHMYVGLLGANDRDTFLFVHALMQIGARTVFLNNRLTSEELAFQLADSQSALLLYADQFAAQVEKLDLAKSSFAEINGSSYEQMFSGREFFAPDDIASVMYTSGTTGKPKGVLQTYQNHFYSATGSALHFGVDPAKDSWLCVVPLFHISGLSILMRSVIYGIPVYLEAQFSAERMNELLQSGKITHVSVVMTMLKRLLDKTETVCHENVKVVLLGGSAVPEQLVTTSIERGYPIVQSFGMTETASQVIALKPEHAKRKIGSSGQALFPVDVRIMVGEQIAPVKTAGEIEIKAPNITPGYLNRKEASQTAFHDGYFKTGDIGYLDEEGFLFVLDRRKDLIVSGGENIYPTEIEHVLLRYPTITEAAVIGEAHSEWGEVPVAYFTASANVSKQELLTFLKVHLARFKVPKKVIQVNELPKTTSGKLKRYALKKNRC